MIYDYAIKIIKNSILAINFTIMKKIFFLGLLFSFLISYSQEHAWVYFTDKPSETNMLANPLLMLSQRSLDRRTRQNISLNYKDVPIENIYINQISAQNGVLVKAKSKWLNAVHVFGLASDIDALLSLPFVDNIEYADSSLNTKVKKTKIVKQNKSKFGELTNYNYGDSYNQAHQIRVDFLHEQNFTGSTMQIAILDAGFPGVDTFSAFQKIRDGNQILGGYNFVDRTSNFYQNSRHGMSVLSTIAGFVDGELIGTAPDANFYLFITEDAVPETPVEESLWVEAAEKADSLGVDIINTSLGYQGFDETRYNHQYSDMNGITTFISRGANIAVEKGIIVVVAAGNDGNNSYFNISAPADAIDVFTIGAVASDGSIANFSSYGPSYDNRIKPDVDAKGFQTTVLDSNGFVTTGSGTSYATPIMSGSIACLWEAFPNKTNYEIMQMIRESAHLYNNPTDQEGYGIPNFETVFQTAKFQNSTLSNINVYPNPIKNTIYINNTNFKKLNIDVFDMFGKKIISKYIYKSKVDVSELNSGIYLLKISDNNKSTTFKILKE